MKYDLRKAIEDANKPKSGAKWKGKAGPSKVVKTLKKQIKKQARKPRSQCLVVQEPSKSITHNDIQEDSGRNDVDDTMSISEPPTTAPVLKVSTTPISSTPFSDFF